MAHDLVRSHLEKSLKASTLADLVRVKTSEQVFLLIDCSGSMGTIMRNGKRRIDGLREAVRDIQKTRPVKMIAFGPAGGGYGEDGSYKPFFAEVVPEPAGGTPLAQTIRFAREQNAGRAVVLSDGEPDDERTALDAASAFGGRIDVIFVGNPGDSGEMFLKRLAEATGGSQFTGDLSEPKQLSQAIVGLLSDGEEDEDDDDDE